MATTNPITGNTIATKPASEQYRDNYDLIFRNKSPASDVLDLLERAESTEAEHTGQKLP